MCGRFIQKSERRIITEEFYIGEFLDEVITSYNVAPGQKAGVIINKGKNTYLLYKWGLVPSWAKDPEIGTRMINARAETLASKPSFKSAFRGRRCLIPADGFYEWKKEGNFKVPYYVFHKSKKPFSLAGLWEIWKNPDDTPLTTFTIITTEANPLLKNLHDRMPVILPPENRDTWLNPESTDIAGLSELLRPFDDQLLDFYEVSRFVNAPQNNTPQCITPVSNA